MSNGSVRNPRPTILSGADPSFWSNCCDHPRLNPYGSAWIPPSIDTSGFETLRRRRRSRTPRVVSSRGRVACVGWPAVELRTEHGRHSKRQPAARCVTLLTRRSLGVLLDDGWSIWRRSSPGVLATDDCPCWHSIACGSRRKTVQGCSTSLRQAGPVAPSAAKKNRPSRKLFKDFSSTSPGARWRAESCPVLRNVFH
jgi:hypothetical protein